MTRVARKQARTAASIPTSPAEFAWWWCGRRYTVRDSDGDVVAVDRTGTKTKHSTRTLPVPPSLWEYICVYTDAFHKRPDGTVPTDVPLLIGFKDPDRP